MRILVATILFSMALLTGCGFYKRAIVANISGYDKICVEGVTYLQFPSGVAVQVDLSGKQIPCTYGN